MADKGIWSERPPDWMVLDQTKVSKRPWAEIWMLPLANCLVGSNLGEEGASMLDWRRNEKKATRQADQKTRCSGMQRSKME